MGEVLPCSQRFQENKIGSTSVKTLEKRGRKNLCLKQIFYHKQEWGEVKKFLFRALIILDSTLLGQARSALSPQGGLWSQRAA